jgi:hypothetical protein
MDGRDRNLSQPVRAVDVLGREPDPNAEALAEERIEEMRRQARERDQLAGLEVRLLHNTIIRVERGQTKVLDALTATQTTQTEILQTLRDIHAAQASTAVETPQLQALALDTLRGIKEAADAIAAVVIRGGTNGHLQET